MPRKEFIQVPKSEFTKSEQLLVIKAMLRKINLGIRRGKKVNIKVRGLGTIHDHGNRKEPKKERQKKYNKKNWLKQKKEMELSTKKLLF